MATILQRTVKQLAFESWQESRGYLLLEPEGVSWDAFSRWWDERTDTAAFASTKAACSESWIAAQAERFDAWWSSVLERASEEPPPKGAA